MRQVPLNQRCSIFRFIRAWSVASCGSVVQKIRLFDVDPYGALRKAHSLRLQSRTPSFAHGVVFCSRRLNCDGRKILSRCTRKVRLSIDVLSMIEMRGDQIATHVDNGALQLTVETDGIPEMGIVLPATCMHVKEAVSALKHGQVIAVPTDTLYGLAADACSTSAVQKIYNIKGRNISSPLAVCVAHMEDLEKYSVTSHLPQGLVEQLLPGPVTLVLLRGEHSLLEKSLNPGLCSIGMRIPDSSFICQVAKAFGGALALTSANPSGQPSTVRVQEFEQLWKHCAYIFDAGEIPAGRTGSTVVDLTIPGQFRIIRTGSAFDETVKILRRFDLVQTSTTLKELTGEE